MRATLPTLAWMLVLAALAAPAALAQNQNAVSPGYFPGKGLNGQPLYGTYYGGYGGYGRNGYGGYGGYGFGGYGYRGGGIGSIVGNYLGGIYKTYIHYRGPGQPVGLAGQHQQSKHHVASH